MNGGTVVAAIRGKIIRAFAHANAFNEADAKNLTELGLRPGYGIFRRMIQKGNIMETSDGRFYMDKVFYEAYLRRKRIVIPIGLALCAIGAIICVVAVLFASR